MSLQEFIQRFAEIMGIEDANTLTPETDFHDLDEWSSLMAVKLLVLFDEEMDKDVSVGEINECFTIEELYNL